MFNIKMTLRLISVDFRVYGRVQGVFFRKFTKLKAEELNIKGWVKNSRDGSVVGNIQGLEEPIDRMKNWLSTTGSPYSKIVGCDFSNQRVINEFEFDSFQVRH